MRGRRPKPQKLRHRPSDELIDIRERGLPWLISVFLVLFLLLTLILIYFVFTTRDIYLSQRDLFAKNEQKEPPIGMKTSSNHKPEKNDEADVHVDIIPILNRRTGLPDEPITFSKPIEISSEIDPTTAIFITTTTEIPQTTTQQVETTIQVMENYNEKIIKTTQNTGKESEREKISLEEILTTPTLPPSFEKIDSSEENTEVEEKFEMSNDTVDTTATIPTVPTTLPQPSESSKIENAKRVKWNREIKSESKKFEQFAISTHHEECSKIGRSIFEMGGNAVDSSIAAEICISALHPHSTGPGFGAIFLISSRKRNGTFVIDGRERAPQIVNQNTFVINPTIAHIGYSSIGIPGWISTLWNAFKQFGSSRISWKDLVEPTILLIEKGIYVDRLLAKAFESRKNHILHEKSFSSLFEQTTREGNLWKNGEYFEFLKIIARSNNAEREFYSGSISKDIFEEIKKRGGLISRQDLESYSSVVTRSEILPIGEHFLAGPHLPYTFPVFAKILKNITEEYGTKNPEELFEYYDDYINLLQKANQMKSLIGDDVFEPEIKLKIEELEIPENFNPDIEIETSSDKKNIQSFSRILAVDKEGNSVNFMSTNSAPFGSVRRSPKYGFIWNNAMSSFDVFCRNEINCVRGGKRPAVPNILPSILLNSQKIPVMLISPTSAPLESTSAIVFNKVIMKLTNALALDTSRIYPYSKENVKVEAGIPDDLYRYLWNTHKAKFVHPSHPVTLLAISPAIEIFCDYRQYSTSEICFPQGL